jgi:hypothetical protein
VEQQTFSQYASDITILVIKDDDMLPTPWGTQMWIQTENNERARSRGTLLGL